MAEHSFSGRHLPEDIGQRISALRKKRGWSQAALARLSGVPRETIVRIEHGSRKPLADTVLRLLVPLLEGQDDAELDKIVPGWPEADGQQVIGHGPRSRVRRRMLRLSAAVVAAAAGISEDTLRRFERGEGPAPSLLKTMLTPHGDRVARLKSPELAKVLRFADLADHEAFCDAELWKDWAIAPVP